MRIGLIYHQFQSGAGGLERYLNGFATHLAADGNQLTLIGSEFDDAFTSIPHAEIHRIRCRGTKSSRMREFATRSGEVAAGLGLDVSLGFGRTFAQDLHRAGGGCHQVYSRFLPSYKRIKRKNRLELDLERRLYTGGDTRQFVVNSGLVGNQLIEEYAVPVERITVIHTPVDSARFQPAEDPAEAKGQICKKLGTDPDRPAFLFVSLSHRRKGLNALLDVWPEIEADLWIAGKPLKRSHHRLIRKSGIAQKIHHFGQTGDLVPYYQAADGFLHPTLYDACANTVLQAMACGAPGLISSRDGASEFVHDGKNAFLLSDPTDREQVLSGIRRIAGLEDGERQKIAEAARQTVVPLTWQTHLKGWHSAIDRVLGSKSA